MKLLNRHAAVLFVGLIVAASSGAISAAKAETFIGANIDERVTLALQVDEAAVQAWLPDGWVVAPNELGPFQGANLIAVFVDRLLQLNAEGEPSGGGAYKSMALIVPAKRADADGTAPMVIRIYSAHDGAGPYENSAKAAVSRKATTNGVDIGGGAGSESWEVAAASGGAVTLTIDYQREVPTPQTTDSRPRSAVNPDYYRIYYVNQLVDIVSSGPAGINRAPNHNLSVSIPELADMFDGNETIIGISVTPSYARQTYLP